VAVASDARWAALLPQVAGRVLHPQARAFGYDRLDDAVAWVAGPGERDGRVPQVAVPRPSWPGT